MIIIDYRNILAVILPALVMVSGCSNEEQSDGYGQFEADETTISAKATGELLSFTATEGQSISGGQTVGLIDTTQLDLKREELLSQKHAAVSRIENIDAEIAVQQEQLQTARKTLDRLQALKKDKATTDQQYDEASGKVNTIEKQILALQTQKKSVKAEIQSVEARLNQIRQQLKDARIVNPINGTVLTTFVEPYELVSLGQPLYRIANLDTLVLRAYVSGAQLPELKLGQDVTVMVDKNAEENRQLGGQISWIASEAEFTPKMIQTKEERVTQVYAVEVRVPNLDGLLKIGMPGEVNFGRKSN